jgi:GntR family transcriptional regulator, transcriptional repressor for pyruvate dehydrogenase complex
MASDSAALSEARQFRRIERKSVVDEIIDQIVHLIRSGSLGPGSRLPSEMDLVERLGVGRSSVREALKALEILGVVQRSNGGTIIAEGFGLASVSRLISANLVQPRLRVAEVYEARRILEVELGVLALRNADAADVAILRDLTERMERLSADDIVEYAGVDREFHSYIASLAGNEVLSRMWEIAYALFLEIRLSVKVTPEFIAASNQRHALLVDAIELADAAGLRATLIDSLKIGQRDLEDGLSNLEVWEGRGVAAPER